MFSRNKSPTKAVFEELVYIIQTGRTFSSFSRSPRRSVTRQGNYLRLSYALSFFVISFISVGEGRVLNNLPLGFLYLGLSIVSIMLTLGLNVVYYIVNTDLASILLTLPMDVRDVNRVMGGAFLEFFKVGYITSVAVAFLAPLILTHSLLVSFQSALEILFMIGISIFLAVTLGTRVRGSVASALGRIGPILMWVGLISLPSINSAKEAVTLPTFILPIYSFAFPGYLALGLSSIYASLAVLGGLMSLRRLTPYRDMYRERGSYSLTYGGPLSAFLSKDIRGVIRVPQAGFLMSIPILTLVLVIFAPNVSVIYTISWIIAASAGLLVLENKGFPLLITVPGGVRYSVISKLILILLVYSISGLILGLFGMGLWAMVLLPSVLAGSLVSIVLSYRSVIKGYGVSSVNPLSFFIRFVESSAIPWSAFLILSRFVLLAEVFSLVSLGVTLFFSLRVIKDY